MTSSHKKAIVATLVLAVAGGYLIYKGITSSRTNALTVDEFLADKNYQSQQVRLRGAVAREGLTLRPGGGEVSFRLLGDQANLPVYFQGAIPDTFGANSEVAVDGSLGKDGVFRARQLLTKCASKYEGDNARGGRPSDTR